MSASDLLQPDPEPAAADPDQEDDVDLEALRMAALKTLKPKKTTSPPETAAFAIKKHSARANLLSIVPVAGEEHQPRPPPPARDGSRSGPPRPPAGSRTPPSKDVYLPARFDVPPPGYPFHGTAPAPAPTAAATGGSVPLLTYPPPLPEYYGLPPRRPRSRSPYGRRSPSPYRRRYSRSPTPPPPRRMRPSPMRRDRRSPPPEVEYSESEEEVEEEVEVTATESEGEDEAPKDAEKAEEKTVKSDEADQGEPDDVLNVHAEEDEFTSMLEKSEEEPKDKQKPAKKKKTKIIKRMVKRPKKKVRPLDSLPVGRPRSPHRRTSPYSRRRPSPRHWGRSRSPSHHRPDHKRSSPAPRVGFRDRSPFRKQGRERSADRNGSQPPKDRRSPVDKDVSKSKSLPPARRSKSRGKSPGREEKRDTHEDREEKLFELALKNAKTQEERDRLIARRKKFQTASTVDTADNKVISLKNVRQTAKGDSDHSEPQTKVPIEERLSPRKPKGMFIALSSYFVQIIIFCILFRPIPSCRSP